MYAYRNKNTLQVQVFAEPNARLDFLNEWEPVDTEHVSAGVAAATDRAAAERASIQAAAAIRLDTAVGASIAAAASSRAAETTSPFPAQSLPTLAVIEAPPTQASSLVAALDKTDPARRAPATPFEVNKALAEHEIRHPPTTGVLTRAKADQRSGAVQIGHNGPPGSGLDRPLGGPHSVPPAPEPGVAPPDDAPQADWVAYAVSCGADEETAKDLDVDQLKQLYAR